MDLRALAVSADNAGSDGLADRVDAEGCSERLRVDDSTDWGCSDGCVLW